MILDEFVLMYWNNYDKKYYVDKGYVFTKRFDKFEVNIKDLMLCSNLKINVKCDICGKEKLLSYRKYLKNMNNGDYYSCSQKCSHNKSKQTSLKNYGVEHYLQSDIGIKRIQNTCLERYGFENVSKNNEIKKRKKQTCLKNYGTEYPSQSKEIQERYKQTCLKKYGCEWPWLNIEVKEKVENTMLKKYGTKNPTQNINIMNSIIQTQIDKYGEIWKNHVPRYNPNSIMYLDLISKKLNIPIQHALNGGEKKFIKYWIDGYIDKYNICIEWDEECHNLENDKKRDEYLKDNFNCKMIRIRQKTFLKNIDIEIEKIVDEINDYILSLKSYEKKK